MLPGERIQTQLDKLEKCVYNIYRSTTQLNGEVKALRETVDAKFKLMEEKIETSNKLHDTINKIHTKQLNNLSSIYKDHDVFINRMRGGIRLLAYGLALVLGLIGVNKLL